MRVLLTGGAGYIGSHTAVALHQAGFEPVVVDNFSNSSPEVMTRLRSITGQKVALARGDMLNTDWMRGVFGQFRPAAVVHLAGLKAVGESVQQPLRYFQQNVGGALSVMRAMEAALPGALPAFVFSSTATVYGDPEVVPVVETAPCRPASPYASSKLMIEQILEAARASRPDAWRYGVLRYFNPVGAHPSGLIGEDPAGIPNNLVPFISQVAVGRRPYLSVFGNDYPTVDGTGVRDYLHVQDLAAGHVAAVRRLLETAESFTVNLGTGRGHSVMEVLRAYERACGRALPYEVVGRRPGDVAEYYADPSLARRLLGWEAKLSLEEMCADAWRWQSGNPQGYA